MDFVQDFTLQRWRKFVAEQGRNRYFAQPFFEDVLTSFGKLNLFAIAGAADLCSVVQGRSVCTDLVEARRRCRREALKYHTDRLIKRGTELSEEAQGRIKVSCSCLHKIKNMLHDLDPGFTLAQYLSEMDQFGDLLWHAEYRAGALDDKEFEESYPIPAPLLEAIEQQSRGGGPPGDGCFHCGMFGHNARLCPFGGSRSYEHGQNMKYGTRPRCFVCANNAPDHYSPNCPYRHPDSYAPVAFCPTCKHALQGRKQHASKCPNCNKPIRCWNCGRQGHQLNLCTKPRYKPSEFKAKAPREEKSRG